MVNGLKNKMRSRRRGERRPVWHKYCQRNYETWSLRSAACFIFAVDINSVPILADLFDPFFFFSRQSLIVCKIWSMYLCHGQAAYPRKKKECHSRSTFMIDARGLAMNIEDSYLSFISDSFIIRISFVFAMLMRTGSDVK